MDADVRKLNATADQIQFPNYLFDAFWVVADSTKINEFRGGQEIKW